MLIPLSSVIASFFEPSIQCIVNGVMEQQRLSTKPVTVSFYVVPLSRIIKLTGLETVFLVGGFSASDYLFSELEKRLTPRGFSVCRPDPYLWGFSSSCTFPRIDRRRRNKAVPDGAIAGYLRPTVRARVAKYTYGVRCQLPFKPSHPEHVKRESHCVTNMNGDPMSPGGFARILVKVFLELLYSISPLRHYRTPK